MEYRFELTGRMPLFMHNDNVEAADELAAWRKDPKNKPLSVPGDDRSPPWTWQTYLHHDGEHVAIPANVIMKALSYAGARIILKGQTTYKSLSQSGLLIPDEFCRFTAEGEPVPMDPIRAMRNDPFRDQAEKVKALGFKLDVRRAKVDNKKHVRTRPRFEEWGVEGTIVALEAAITPAILDQLFDIAGRLAGLLDWRPSAKISPGPFGTFRATVTPLGGKGRKAG